MWHRGLGTALVPVQIRDKEFDFRIVWIRRRAGQQRRKVLCPAKATHPASSGELGKLQDPRGGGSGLSVPLQRRAASQNPADHHRALRGGDELSLGQGCRGRSAALRGRGSGRWLPGGYPLVTRRLPTGYLVVTHWLPSGYPLVTWRLPTGYPVVTRRLPTGYPAVTHWLPGGYLADTLRHFTAARGAAFREPSTRLTRGLQRTHWAGRSRSPRQGTRNVGSCPLPLGELQPGPPAQAHTASRAGLSLSRGAGEPWLPGPCVPPAAAAASLATGFSPPPSQGLSPSFRFAEISSWPCLSRAESCSPADVCFSSKILSLAVVLKTQAFSPKWTSSLSVNK